VTQRILKETGRIQGEVSTDLRRVGLYFWQEEVFQKMSVQIVDDEIENAAQMTEADSTTEKKKMERRMRRQRKRRKRRRKMWSFRYISLCWEDKCKFLSEDMKCEIHKERKLLRF
jgi:hypothetical protein